MLLLSLLTSLALVGVDASPTIKLGNTKLVGLDITLLGVDFFGGIPFAEPPLGNLRLQPPVLKPIPDQGRLVTSLTLNASSFGPACLQTAVPVGTMSEDCLTINIYRPTGTPADAKLPVVDFNFSPHLAGRLTTYSGGFDSGLSTIFNGSGIVAQSVARGTPVVYVNFNYRLGPLGFPQGQEADNRGSLNLGIKDQLAALEWVTVFGESAGSVMTSILFLNSPIKTFARAAIFESGSQATVALFTPERREGNWETFVGGVASCASTEAFPWDPVIDGTGGLIPDLPSVLFSRGHFSRLPFMAGTNLDEGTLFTTHAINSSDEIVASITAMNTPSVSPATLECSVEKLLQLYPDIPELGSPFNTGNETFGLSSQYKRAAAMVGDLDFASQRRLWIETAANAGVPTWGYLFTQPQPNSSPAQGIFHGSEVTFVYGAPSDNSTSALNISRLMTDYWVSFATSLTPNDGLGIPRPEWAQFTPNNKAVIQLNGANLTMIPDDFRAEQIAFINSNPSIWHH
ncbi:extracellular triacylglycerol lipase precursor [Mycena rosella]|uniref:Extracellular triacylglycerol lipase n=1 Tax=Mycena rosella TaxID=1033263 RepID=A0AAD7GQ38_MYCRO|nr:extracellular triacylglycerol lipase precursor [Mycena rosella]